MKDYRSKDAAAASGSWFHNRIVDGNKDSLCTVVLLYGTIYFCCCPLVAAPRWCMHGGGSIATSPLIIRYIISGVAAKDSTRHVPIHNFGNLKKIIKDGLKSC